MYRRIKDFCNLFEGYKKINEIGIIKVVTASKGVEYIPSKLYENKTRDQKSIRTSSLELILLCAQNAE